MTLAERRIPVQYAKRVVGRKMYGGQNSFMPIKVNMSGVMPIIFASSLLSLPGIIKDFTNPAAGSFWDVVLGWFNYNSWVYAILYFFLIIAFNYFYVGTQYNPIEMSNNIRKNNGTIPGIRPGKPTSDFISKILGKDCIDRGAFPWLGGDSADSLRYLYRHESGLGRHFHVDPCGRCH